MARLSREDRMTIQCLAHHGQANRAVARMLGVTEGTVRYHRGRQAAGATDGRAKQVSRAAAYHAAITDYLVARDEATPSNSAELHAWLVAEHDYPGSLRSLQRYLRRVFPPPAKRARRRVETPPGAQAQADWAMFPRVWLGGRRRDLLAFLLQLSFSRGWALIWSERRDLLSWLHVHNAALTRLGGVPATIRVDNEKTAIVAGAGAWGTPHPVYRRYAESLRFHIDACAPRSPQAKGKVERRIRDGRVGCSPYRQHWNDLEELQTATDRAVEQLMARRTCPATGTPVRDAWHQEHAALGGLPEPLPEPFDIAVCRRVGGDCTVVFEDRHYSVPFAWLDRRVEIHGCAHSVQIFAGGAVVATHPRATRERIVIDPAHYDGPSTPAVTAPVPLGRMGTRLAEIAAMAPQERPLDLYAALAEVAR